MRCSPDDQHLAVAGAVKPCAGVGVFALPHGPLPPGSWTVELIQNPLHGIGGIAVI
jgi:hypothetical protein